MDPPDLEGARSIEGKDAAVGRLKLCVNDRRQPAGCCKQEEDGNGDATDEHSLGLLATTAWKSKRLVFSARGDG